MPPEVSNPATSAEMVNPSKTASTQDDCPLFKLAAETRNEIYELVYAIETKEDGSIELDDTTGSNALARTCQQIYYESRGLHKEAYRLYPHYTFTLNVLDRGKHDPFSPALRKEFFRQMISFRVNWRADEHNQGKPLRFTTHFDKTYPPREEGKLFRFASPDDGVDYQRWTIRLELHDEYWRGKEAGDELIRGLRSVMNDYYAMGSDQPQFIAARVTQIIERAAQRWLGGGTGDERFELQ